MEDDIQQSRQSLDTETSRLEALQRYGILDTPSEDIFDRITAAAMAACEVPIGVISLIDSDRLWFLSRAGVDATETLRENSFCSYAAAFPKEVTEIADALNDARFKTNTLVVNEPRVRFYAGMPLCTADGYELGTLSVLDRQPRVLSEAQRSTLGQLAKLIMLLLEHRTSSPVSVIGRAVEEALPSGVVIIDPQLPDCPITFCNKGFETLTGYENHEIIGRNYRFLNGVATDGQKIQEIQDAIENERTLTTVIKNYKRDGTAFWNEITLSPLVDGAGKLSHYLAFQYDVSERVSSMQELESSHERLRMAVDEHAEASDALSLANHALVREITQRKKMEQQSLRLQNELVHIDRLSTTGEMATGLAHELNQPLLAISQCADTALLVAKENSNSDPELINCINDIQTQTQRAGEIIRALREFISRDTSKRSAVDVNELVDQAISLTKSDSRALNMRIEFIRGAIPEPYIDRVQFAQVLVNLLRNSVDAISSVFSHATPEVQHNIIVKTRLQGDNIVVCITDTGPGFDTGIEPFKPFESSKKDGLGIGLSISRSIIESHQGKLWMENSSSSGCTMYISIPVVQNTNE